MGIFLILFGVVMMSLIEYLNRPEVFPIGMAWIVFMSPIVILSWIAAYYELRERNMVNFLHFLLGIVYIFLFAYWPLAIWGFVIIGLITVRYFVD